MGSKGRLKERGRERKEKGGLRKGREKESGEGDGRE